MTMKYLKGLAITLLAFLMLYLAGPRPAKPAYSTVLPEVPSEALALEQYIRDQEAQHAIKPNNEARIVWANDSLRTPTEYALVYLHGFSASQMEGDPVSESTARSWYRYDSTPRRHDRARVMGISCTSTRNRKKAG